MSLKRVSILTEGGKSIGFGHITRNLALCSAFEEKGIRPEFLVNGDNNAKSLLAGKNYRIMNWVKNKMAAMKLLKDADIAIVDSYRARKTLYQEIFRAVNLTVCVDDNNRLDYPQGIVVNGSINAQALAYAKRGSSRYLLGTRYIPLRREFWAAPVKKINSSIKNVMVTFGGDDSKGMTPKIMELLNTKAPDVKKNIIIGKAFKDINKIKSLKDDKTKLVFCPNAAKMEQVMRDADLAISSGGQTLYELARIGVPTIAIAVADNQLNNVKGWARRGFIDYAGTWKEKDVLKNVERLIERSGNKNIRARKSRIGRAMVDGQGARRVVQEILKEL